MKGLYMMQEVFKSMISGIEAKLKEKPDAPNPRKKYALEIARLGQRLYSGNRVAWCGVAAPFDLLNTMGVTSCFIEFIGATLATMNLAQPFLQEAEHRGYASDACGYHRAVIGAAYQGMMPIPDFLIGTTCPCSGGLATIENLARHFKKDLFVLHIPQEESNGGVEYLADQMKEMTKFISAHTGENLDEDQFSKAIERSNKARELMTEVYRLAQHVPSPNSSHDLSDFGIIMTLFFGREEAIDMAKAYRDEFAARIKVEKNNVSGEKVRLLWIQNRIQFRNPLIAMLEKEYQAKIVVDELNDITWEPIDLKNPYIGLAKRAISIPFNGNIEHRLVQLKKLAKNYKIDGAINPCHWGCRQGTGARGLIETGLKEIGVPVLNLEVDCIDERNFAEGQLRTRLEAFVEMIGHGG